MNNEKNKEQELVLQIKKLVVGITWWHGLVLSQSTTHLQPLKMIPAQK